MLSETVANAIAREDKPELRETEQFCRYFNKFFDCLNTRSVYEGQRKRNHDVDPYTSANDQRIEVCTVAA